MSLAATVCLGHLAVHLYNRLGPASMVEATSGNVLFPAGDFSQRPFAEDRMDDYQLGVMPGIGQAAFRIASAGSQVYLVSRLGRDAYGDLLLSTFKRKQINTMFCRRPFNSRTNCFVSWYDKNGKWHQRQTVSSCQICREDVLAAKAAFADAELLIMDTDLPADVRDAAYDYATFFSLRIQEYEAKPHRPLVDQVSSPLAIA